MPDDSADRSTITTFSTMHESTKPAPFSAGHVLPSEPANLTEQRMPHVSAPVAWGTTWPTGEDSWIPQK